MDLNNLDLPEPEKTRLRQELEKLHRDYETDLENLIDDATETIEQAKPIELQDMVLEYTRDASERARRYYDDTRNLWQRHAGVEMPAYVSADCDEYEVLYRQVGGFGGTDWNGHNYTNLKQGNANGLTVDDLWPDLKTVDDWQQFIADMMNRSVRLTTQNNRDADPTHPGWARVPRGSDPCSFCVMLASRGFAYTSEESADFGSSFHNGKCRCVPVCSWGKDRIFGYDQEKYKVMYDQAVAAIENGAYGRKWKSDAENSGIELSGENPKAITFIMRHKFPRQLRDGIEPKKRAPFSVERDFTGMRKEKSLSKKGWDGRQKALGISVDSDVLEMHEIVFLEHFKSLGQHYEWIPRDTLGHKSTNDMEWVEQGLVCEVKSSRQKRPDYGSISKNISKAVSKAELHGVVKDSFIVDLTGYAAPEKLINQLAGYNAKHKKNRIKRLFLLDANGLRELKLQ
ncbi:hypothetical protein [Bifidobacterium dentium]|uniref:VG15 protein n=1 Tax=Bifidobacterium dentium TaxID=1689 RepID=UPI0018B08F1C|nr:hypothetical protein [Bifidobacterium dentium]MBF9694105.1 hypothetical protein [Bifidobacterium dentium]